MLPGSLPSTPSVLRTTITSHLAHPNGCMTLSFLSGPDTVFCTEQPGLLRKASNVPLLCIKSYSVCLLHLEGNRNSSPGLQWPTGSEHIRPLLGPSPPPLTTWCWRIAGGVEKPHTLELAPDSQQVAVFTLWVCAWVFVCTDVLSHPREYKLPGRRKHACHIPITFPEPRIMQSFDQTSNKCVEWMNPRLWHNPRNSSGYLKDYDFIYISPYIIAKQIENLTRDQIHLTYMQLLRLPLLISWTIITAVTTKKTTIY